MEKYVTGILGAVLAGYSFWLIPHRLFLKNRRKNRLCFLLYAFLFVFLLDLSNYFIKFFCCFFIKEGWKIYESLFFNRIFTVGLIVFFSMLVITNGLEKEDRQYCRQHRRILFILLIQGVLLAELMLYGLYQMKVMCATEAFLVLLPMPVYVVVICLTERYFSRQSGESERAEFKAKVQRQIIYYQEMEKNQREVYKLYHDMKNHLAMIENLQGNKEVQEYIGKCMDKVQQVEGMAHTGNVYADTMIYDKWKLAGKYGIDFIMTAEDKVFEGIDIFDLTVLIGNILDNAVEATQREAQGQRRIFFKAWKQGSLSVMMVENTCSLKPKRENGELVTAKKDRKYHGFGIKNVEEMVKKYCGKVKIEYKDEKFRVLVMFYGKGETI